MRFILEKLLSPAPWGTVIVIGHVQCFIYSCHWLTTLSIYALLDVATFSRKTTSYDLQ